MVEYSKRDSKGAFAVQNLVRCFCLSNTIGLECWQSVDHDGQNQRTRLERAGHCDVHNGHPFKTIRLQQTSLKRSMLTMTVSNRFGFDTEGQIYTKPV